MAMGNWHHMCSLCGRNGCERRDGQVQKLGRRQNSHDPCLFTGFISDPEDPSDSPSSQPLTLGLYVDDFVYFSTDDAVEKKFDFTGLDLDLNFNRDPSSRLNIIFDPFVGPSYVRSIKLEN